MLEGFIPLLPEETFFLKYLEMVFISFFDLAGRGGRGGALLMVTGVGLGTSLLELPAEWGIRGVNLADIFFLRELVPWSVSNESHRDS